MKIIDIKNRIIRLLISIKNIKTLTILLFFVGLVLTIIVFFFYLKVRPNAINLISLVGSFASVYGICVGVLQIISVKKSIGLTNTAISSTVEKIETSLTISELSSASKLIEEIQAYLTANEYSVSLVRLKDLKEIIIEHSFRITEFDKLIPIITDDVNNLSKKVNESKKIRVQKIRENLETIKTEIIKTRVTLNPLYYANR
jgi:hypothetical protein